MAALALADPGVCNAFAVLPDRVCHCMGGRPGRISEWQDRRFAEGRARDSIAFDERSYPALDLSQPVRWYGAQHRGCAWRADWLERVSLTSPCETLRVYARGLDHRSRLGNLAFSYTFLLGFFRLPAACLVLAAVLCDRGVGA